MKKYFLFLAVLCLSISVFAQRNTPSAVDQMHNAMTQSLANTEYYDEAHKNMPNAHGVATKENLTGEAELLRQGIGAPFVENKGGKYSKVTKPGEVKAYIAHSTADPNNTIVMESPVSIPPVSDPVSVSDDDIDNMMLSALGGDSAIKASQNSNYQGNYETAVGQKTEQNFDMSDKIAAATKKQAAADRQYAALNANNKAKSEDDEPGFWGQLGKTFMQGLANVAIETTNYKYGTNIETIGNTKKTSGGNKNQTCSLEGVTFHGDTCTYCVYNRPRSSSDCSKCCYSFGRSLMQAPSYSATSSGGRPAGCLCRFGPTSGYRF